MIFLTTCLSLSQFSFDIYIIMSSQKGNVRKSGPQKYQNRQAFKNNLHDTTPRVKLMNNVMLGGVCKRCKDVIDWKIKYKKYKPLTVPKKW